jgi:DNA polymerase-3 subunit alpha
LTFISGDPARNIPGCAANGVPPEVASSIYDEIFDFANYAFNKAHAVAYAVIAYQTAYLKKHYPREYMAALLSSVLGWPEKIAEYAAECREMGIQLLPPDVNTSVSEFSVEGGDIRYGLVAAKNIGRGFIAGLVEEREKNGAFHSLEEFVRRLHGADTNKRAIESLIKCGALDSFGFKRSQLMAVLEPIMRDVSDTLRKNVEGQIDLFGFGESDAAPAVSSSVHVPELPEFSRAELMSMEHEVTGMYLSGHPIDEYRAKARELGVVNAGGILADFTREDGPERYQEGQEVKLIGVVSYVRAKTTKNNSQMAYVTIDDGTGSIELIVFARVLDACGGYLAQNAVILVTGKISARDDKAPQIMANMIRPVSDLDGVASPDAERRLYVKIPARTTRVCAA